MSFGVNLAGSVSAVKKACDQISQHESPHGIAVKELIKKILENAPEGTVVMVEAGGHHDYSPNSTYPTAYVDVKFRLSKVLPE
jgi:hypothetical protein